MHRTLICEHCRQWSIKPSPFSLFLLLTLLQMPPFFPLRPPPPSPCQPSLWPSPHCFLCLWVIHTCSLANPFTFFHPVPTSPSPLTAVSQTVASLMKMWRETKLHRRHGGNNWHTLWVDLVTQEGNLKSKNSFKNQALVTPVHWQSLLRCLFSQAGVVWTVGTRSKIRKRNA